ncbi:MAG: hypothetical protein LBS04_07895 [Tannerellaceae bacterium]|jgi:hypothetical protein|nr:hypothetical protein [Tannerellaceae bacterium]
MQYSPSHNENQGVYRNRKKACPSESFYAQAWIQRYRKLTAIPGKLNVEKQQQYLEKEAETIMDFLVQLKEKYSMKPIFLVLDIARYYDSPDKFHHAIKCFFDTVNETCHDCLGKLLSLNF